MALPWGGEKTKYGMGQCGDKNVKEISESHKWITRVPKTLSEGKEVLEKSDTEKMSST